MAILHFATMYESAGPIGISHRAAAYRRNTVNIGKYLDGRNCHRYYIQRPSIAADKWFHCDIRQKPLHLDYFAVANIASH